MVVVGSAFAKDTISGKVMEVREGDLLVVSVGDGVMVNVRLDQVDCPEKGQAYFEEARRFTEKLAAGKDVIIEVTEQRRDMVVGVVTLTQKDRILNYELVEAGLAWHLQQGLSYTEHTEALLDLMDAAQAKEKGLWKEGNPTAPWAYKQRQSMYEAKSSME